MAAENFVADRRVVIASFTKKFSPRSFDAKTA
jgi:hypothetical protein